MNPTLEKYKYPVSLVREYDNWAVLIRPWQLTPGCLMFVEKSRATAVGELPPDTFQEFGLVSSHAESVLLSLFQYDKINYVLLMMSDPNVHFHIIPRYGSSREFQGIQYTDSGWPKAPDMTFAQPADANQLEALRKYLSDHWPQS